MCPGMADDLQQVDDSRKTAIIDRELNKLNIDVAALQETRLPDNGSIKEINYTFFWQGKDHTKPRLHGVGFAVKNTLLPLIEPPQEGTERLLCINFSAQNRKVHIISAYAPTLTSSDEVKDQFYEELNCLLTQIPARDQIYILGDLNARIGNDHEAWPDCLGRRGIGKINNNGQRL